MAAEDKPAGYRENSDSLDNEPIISTTAEELAAEIRGESLTRKEPDVVSTELDTLDPIGDVEKRDASREPARSADDDRINAALQTIEDLKRQNAHLTGRVEEVSRGNFRTRIEPDIETVEVFPGFSIAKDPDKRPIRLTPDMVRAVGLDPDTAQPLEILGNALYAYIANNIPPMAVEAWNVAQSSMRSAEERQSSFFNSYEDLKEFPDLVTVVEQDARRRGAHMYWKDDIRGYQEDIAMQARQRIARMRGQDLNTYVDSLGNRGSVRNINTPARSRAVSAGSGNRGRGSTVSDKQREIDEL